VAVAKGRVATIQRLYGALAARDASAIQEVFAPDVTIRQSPDLPSRALVPRGHPVRCPVATELVASRPS